jgi:hypothetical protein
MKFHYLKLSKATRILHFFLILFSSISTRQKLIVSVTFVFFLSNNALATGSDNVGGGGDAVVCFESPQKRNEVEKILIENRELPENKDYNLLDPFTEDVLESVTVQSLDLVEFGERNFVKRQWRSVDSEKDFFENVRDIFRAIEAKNLFGKELLQQMNTVTFYGNNQVADVDDSNVVIGVGARCLIVQVAHRKGTRIFVNSKLFDLMPLVHKVALVLHEYLYSFIPPTNDTTHLRDTVSTLMTKDYIENESFNLANNLWQIFGPFDMAVDAYAYIVQPEKVIFEPELVEKSKFHTDLISHEGKALGSHSCYDPREQRNYCKVFPKLTHSRNEFLYRIPSGQTIKLDANEPAYFWGYNTETPAFLTPSIETDLFINGETITSACIKNDELSLYRNISSTSGGHCESISFHPRSGRVAFVFTRTYNNDHNYSLYKYFYLSDSATQVPNREKHVSIHTPALNVFFGQQKSVSPNSSFTHTLSSKTGDVLYFRKNPHFARNREYPGRHPYYSFDLTLNQETAEIESLLLQISSLGSLKKTQYADPLTGQIYDIFGGEDCELQLGKQAEVLKISGCGEIQ